MSGGCSLCAAPALEAAQHAQAICRRCAERARTQIARLRAHAREALLTLCGDAGHAVMLPRFDELLANLSLLQRYQEHGLLTSGDPGEIRTDLVAHRIEFLAETLERRIANSPDASAVGGDRERRVPVSPRCRELLDRITGLKALGEPDEETRVPDASDGRDPYPVPAEPSPAASPAPRPVRRRLRFPVLLEPAGLWGISENVSATGVFVGSLRTARPGEELLLTLHGPSGTVSVSGLVRWVQDQESVRGIGLPRGMGIEFSQEQPRFGGP